MKFRKMLILSVLVIVITMLFLVPSMVIAEEIVDENIEESVENSENENPIVNGYDEAKDVANDAVEQLGLKEFLSKYFEENMVDLIITITVTVLSAIIFLSSIFITLRKLFTCIKKYGIESDATKVVINDLTNQLKQTETAYNDCQNAFKLVKDNNELINKELERIKEAFIMVIKQNDTLIKEGKVDEVINYIEEV